MVYDVLKRGEKVRSKRYLASTLFIFCVVFLGAHYIRIVDGSFALNGTSLWVLLSLTLKFSDQVDAFDDNTLSSLNGKYLAALAFVSAGDNDNFLFAFDCLCHD